MTTDICTCSGHANEPNPCPVCLGDTRRAERLEDDFRLGKFDHEFGEFVWRLKREDDIAKVCQRRLGGHVRRGPEGLEIETYAAEFGWRRGEYVPLCEVAIGQAYREDEGPECEAFLAEEIARRLEPKEVE